MSYPLSSLNPNPEDPLLTARIRERVRGSAASRATFRQSVLRIGEIEGHHGNRPYNIVMDFLIFVVTLLEISVVVFLAVTHFEHSMGLTALAMLLPILLNCVGVIYFLSDKNERQELEKVGCTRCLTDFLQVPILGPVFTAFKVMAISCGCTSHENYERIEASALKLRQASGFFCAAPETLVQLTALLVMNPATMQTEGHGNNAQSSGGDSHDNDDHTGGWTKYLEIGAVCLFVFTLAESNCYNVLSNYYKMFSNSPKRQSWRLNSVTIWQKLLLFLHAFSSIGSRIISSAALKAAILYCWKKYHEKAETTFPLVIVLVVFAEISVRLVLYYICRLLKFWWMEKEVPSSCYESINFAWRSTILNYSFQSTNIFLQVLFYLENVLCFFFWIASAKIYGDDWVLQLLFVPTCIVFFVLTGLSMVFLAACSFFELIRMHGPCTLKIYSHTV